MTAEKQHSKYGARLVAALIGLAVASCAHAETINCDGAGGAGSGAGRISSVPYTISAPGVYCVTQKISTNLVGAVGGTTAAITVNANNVVIDLNGFAIGNLAAGPSTQAFGILAQDRQNIYVRNGVLRGFFAGVALVHGTSNLSSGHRVEGMTLDTSYASGIWVQGPHGTIIGNRVMNTRGDPTTYTSANAIIFSAGGATTAAAGGVVADNLVLDTDCANACAAGDPAYGIVVNGAPGTVIQGNRLLNSVAPTATASWAIRVGMAGGGVLSTNVFVLNNMMSNWQTGIQINPGQGATGDFRLNGALGITGTAYVGGTNIANGAINY